MKSLNSKWMERIYGRDGVYSTPYLTRIRLLNSNPSRWFSSGLFLHKFHRGDWDRAFHDHPWGFWTFPLRTYYEDILEPNGNIVKNWPVQGWKWHYKENTHTHMIRQDQSFPLYTIVLPGPKAEQSWGFWVTETEALEMGCYDFHLKPTRGNLVWIPWRKYVYNSEHMPLPPSQQIGMRCSECGEEVIEYAERTTRSAYLSIGYTGYSIFKCSNCGLEKRLINQDTNQFQKYQVMQMK